MVLLREMREIEEAKREIESVEEMTREIESEVESKRGSNDGTTVAFDHDSTCNSSYGTRSVRSARRHKQKVEIDATREINDGEGEAGLDETSDTRGTDTSEVFVVYNATADMMEAAIAEHKETTRAETKSELEECLKREVRRKIFEPIVIVCLVPIGLLAIGIAVWFLIAATKGTLF